MLDREARRARRALEAFERAGGRPRGRAPQSARPLTSAAASRTPRLMSRPAFLASSPRSPAASRTLREASREASSSFSPAPETASLVASHAPSTFSETLLAASLTASPASCAACLAFSPIVSSCGRVERGGTGVSGQLQGGGWGRDPKGERVPRGVWRWHPGRAQGRRLRSGWRARRGARSGGRRGRPGARRAAPRGGVRGR
jgi:hypothetical protein